MSDKLITYSVAGFSFSIRYEDMEETANYTPFRTDKSGEHIFDLLVSRQPLQQRYDSEQYFRTNDGDDFPEITIHRAEGGWVFCTRPLPGQPLSGITWISADFTRSQLQLIGPDTRFALDNAAMLMFTFASAHRGALEMHSSVVMNDGKGYMFLGKSGTGKSTHSNLWLKHIPGTELLNDDNPVLRVLPDGSARVFGSPWSGKTPCYKQASAPAGAIVRLEQAPENRIKRLGMIQAYASLMSSSSSFRPFSDLAEGWHKTLEQLASTVPCYALECLPDAAAAELCHSTVSRNG